MPLRFLGFACLLIGLALGLPQPSDAAAPRVALVIGNADYGPEIGRLKNPVNDAKLMAETLQSLGFKVDLVLDADSKAMKQAIKGFGAKLREAGADATGLFYYAGHGLQVDGENYLVPVGAAIESEADAEFEAVPAAYAVKQMEVAGNAVNLVFLDACRNNPLTRSFRSGTRGLARVDAPRGSFVGYSTAPGDVATDGDGANSPYALALAMELKTPGISVEEAHRNVRAKVLAVTGNKQTPWDSSSLTGAVVLAEKPIEPAPQPVVQPAPAPAQPAVQQHASVDKEVVFWESIKDSTDTAEFEAYLKKYPDGTFGDLAKAKIAKLRSPPAARVPASSEDAAASAPAMRLVVSAAIKQEIEVYLSNVSGARFWALAVAKDGSKVERLGCQKTGYQPCKTQGSGQMTQQATNEQALKNCGGTSACILVYEGDRKVANLDLATQ